MGDFNPEKDRAEIHGGSARIIGVSSVDEGCRVAENLISEGIGCIELCGAFSPADAEKIVRQAARSGDGRDHKIGSGGRDILGHCPGQVQRTCG